MFSGIIYVSVDPMVSDIFHPVIETAFEPLLKSSINSVFSEDGPLGFGKTSLMIISAAKTVLGTAKKNNNNIRIAFFVLCIN